MNFFDHLGVLLFLVPLLGSSLLSITTSANWWLTAVVAIVELLVIYAAGSYLEWRDTERAIAEVLFPSIDATLGQLRGERGRANAWLGQLREGVDESTVSSIEWVFDTFWMQTIELVIKPRDYPGWQSFIYVDHADGDLQELPKDERERVFRKVQSAVKRLDAVIASFEASATATREFLER